jgi:hypothetical protein
MSNMSDIRLNDGSAFDEVAAHRHAYNAAFYELGFKWHWDSAIYQSVSCADGEKQRIHAYLEQHHPHMLKAYDVDFLVDVIRTTQARCFETMAANGMQPAAFVNWAEFQQLEVGV